MRLQAIAMAECTERRNRMEKEHIVTGYCPVMEKDIPCKVKYIFNLDCWEKGISDPPCPSPCSSGCPILESAPEELGNF